MSTKDISAKKLYFIFQFYSIRYMLSKDELYNTLTEQSSVEEDEGEWFYEDL